MCKCIEMSHCPWSSRARWYLHWSRAVLLSWGLRGGLSSEEKSPEVATSSWGACGSCLSGHSSGSVTEDTTASIRDKQFKSHVWTVWTDRFQCFNFMLWNINKISMVCDKCAIYECWQYQTISLFISQHTKGVGATNSFEVFRQDKTLYRYLLQSLFEAFSWGKCAVWGIDVLMEQSFHLEGFHLLETEVESMNGDCGQWKLWTCVGYGLQRRSLLAVQVVWCF